MHAAVAIAARGRKEAGAAVGPIAGARAPCWWSAAPSSGLAPVPQKTVLPGQQPPRGVTCSLDVLVARPTMERLVAMTGWPPLTIPFVCFCYC